MFLVGQLPGGPASDNVGGQTTPGAISALFGAPDLYSAPSPKLGSNPLDQLKNKFWVTPDGGPVVVSPSVATAPNIVQYPHNEPDSGWAPQTDIPPASCGMAGLEAAPAVASITPGVGPANVVVAPVAPPAAYAQGTPSGRKPCPGYANDGSLISLRRDAFRNGLEGLGACCRSGYQSFENLAIEPETPKPNFWIFAVGGLLLLAATRKDEKQKGRG